MESTVPLEIGLVEKVQIIDGLKTQITVYKRHLEKIKDNAKEKEEYEKKLAAAEAELKRFEPIVPESSVIKEEGTTHRLIYYSDYLMLDRILGSQHPISALKGSPGHDEMLFIIIHQAYELWFKQILYEMSTVIEMLGKDFVPSTDIGRIVHHLNRVTEIQRLLVQQLTILETMTSMDFMDFRDFLFPASGFQSWQFRLLENRLGIDQHKRMLHENKAYHTKLSSTHQHVVQDAEIGKTLFQAVENWLERFPFFNTKNWDFLEEYKKSVAVMLGKDEQSVKRDAKLHPSSENKALEEGMKILQLSDDRFKALFDEEYHKEQIQKEKIRISFKATQAALIILAYENEPLLYAPSRLLHTLLDVDENLSEWRFKHMMMVQRMIGTRVGTGGSSGYYYLKSTLERSKVFSDIANLSTFLIPRNQLPKLPQELKTQLGFHHEVLTQEQHDTLKKK